MNNNILKSEQDLLDKAVSNDSSSNGSKLVRAVVLAMSFMVAGCCNDSKTSVVNTEAIPTLAKSGETEPVLAVGSEAVVVESAHKKEQKAEIERFAPMMPDIKEQMVDYKFPIPEDLKMDESEFEVFIRPLVEKVRVMVKKTGEALGKDGGDQVKIAREFIYAIESEMKKDPKGKDYIYATKTKTGLDAEEHYLTLGHQIAKALLAGGYFLDVALSGNYDEDQDKIVPVIDLKGAPIKQSKIYKVTDKDGSVDAPVAILDKVDFTPDANGDLAFYVPQLDIVVYLKADYEKRSNARYDELNRFGMNPDGVSREELLKHYHRDTLNHEVTHVYLSNRFPTVGRAFNSRVTMNLKLALPLGNGRMADMSGRMNPVNLHELCAIGNEMYQSEGTLPESLHRYLAHGRIVDPMSGYQLVTSILPLLTIINAPDSMAKDRLLAILNENQPLNTLEINKLVRDTYTPEDVKVLGGRLYEICQPRIVEAERQLNEMVQRNPNWQ